MLPDKWFITITDNEEETKVYREFFESKNNNANWSYRIGYIYNFEETTTAVGGLLGGLFFSGMGFKEITFKEFQKYKVGIEIDKPKQPEDYTYLIDFLKKIL